MLRELKASAGRKWSALWMDKRAFRTRLFLAAACAFNCVFTFIFFGPCELYLQNTSDMTFPFSLLAPVMALAGLGIFAVLLAVLLVLRGKPFNYAVSLLFAVTLAGYLQGNFWNVDHGTLDGTSVTWQNYRGAMLKNLVVWMLVIGAVFLLLYFSRKLWTRTLETVSLLLAAMQTVALFSLVNTTNLSALQERYLSTEGIFELAPSQNVVFFLLDRCDRSYLDDLIAQHPEWEAELGGFTSYQDFTGSFSRTYASVTYLLTGVRDDDAAPFEIRKRDYFRRAWGRSSFLSDLHNTGCQVGLYSHVGDVIGEMDNVEGKIDNIGQSTVSYSRRIMLTKMLELSAYRYAPEAVKPYFQLYTGDLDAVQTASSGDLYQIDDPEFWARYRAQGLSVNDGLTGCFRFYHLQGAHYPFNMSETAERVETRWDSAGQHDQMVGNMEMILQYLDELREKGVYDDTTIIISTDHAADYPEWVGDDWMATTQGLSRLDSPRLLPLLIKPAHADTSQPMQLSHKQICQDNLRASIAGWFGLDTAKYGRTIESIGEDEDMARTFWMLLYDEALTTRDAYMGTYVIRGDGNDFSNWNLTQLTPLEPHVW
ncbi:MAG: hypothetical protein HDT33_02340 [Clostridiales bacterium]|nr:hypothetical protein [Clostridiales bacterium]